MGLFILSIVIAAAVLLVGEYVRRSRQLSNEVSRKLVHVTHGLLVAVWPFIVGYWLVVLVEVLFIVAVIAARKFGWFPWLWRVGRKSYGELWYPVGILAAVVLADSTWIYLAAALQLAVADSAAAIIGTRYSRHFYTIFGQKKSVRGSFAFFVVSIGVIGAVVLYAPLTIGQSAVIIVPCIALALTAIENVGVCGSDNVCIPVAAVLLLNSVT